MTEKDYFRFVKYSLSNDNKLFDSSSLDWDLLFQFASKQSILGILFEGVEKFYSSISKDNPQNGSHFAGKDLLFEWIGAKEVIRNRNGIINERVKTLYELFRSGGFRSCLLKGQGNAHFYPKPELRNSGDIDMWVEGDRAIIVSYLKSLGVNVHDIHLVHANADFFCDTNVEVHFIPACFNNPWRQKRFKKFVQECGREQFEQYDSEVGYVHPTVSFNLVYNLVHIYLHVLGEGIGLRQIIDYYYILKHSEPRQRVFAYEQIQSLHLERFAASLMFVLKDALGIDESLLLCQPDEKRGKNLLQEIIDGGNFGRYGKFASRANKNQRIKRGFENLIRNVRFLTVYPGEVLCIPFFKIWHWSWRKRKGYL